MLLIALSSQYAEAGRHKTDATCGLATKRQKSSYPPPNTPLKTGEAKVVPWQTVDLDAPASTRWSHIVTPQKVGIKALTEVVVDTFEKILGKARFASILAVLTKDFHRIKLPLEMSAEIIGIARDTEIELGVIFIYNLFYSVFGACTSIVAEDDKGGMFHARNLDFGLWPAFNITHGNLWELTSRLRPLVINVDVQKNKKTLYKTTTFNGFIGGHTLMRPGGVSATIDTRFDTGFDAGLLEKLLLGNLDKGTEITMAVREMIETSATYEEALDFINRTTTLGPGYIILGGPKAGNGMVVTKGETHFGHEGHTVYETSLASQVKNGSDYLVQTNYDGDADGSKPPSPIDNRRDPAKKCMKQIGPEETNFANLYALLSSTPNLNRLTAYTTLMNVQTGQFETYRQLCDSLDCPLF